ncbi:epoxide hydrolase N-terminal domain-containing protein [Actinoplanes sp. NBRC 103695]|uniref:epoxide hydrolase N-terminal domain-containing protein n=1 Tax=Actinoplanes sp. NBRC 103695 TaxID=3032202 RepID=UPI002554BF58|nr:epoxide hydrolase N-terminal domain-containing protein [Actinoplanes sp. NBRC 103695]
MKPFPMYAEPADLDDLRARLRATRWPDAPEDAGWSLGADIAYLRELVDHWAGWTPPEDRLPRFRTRVREAVQGEFFRPYRGA